LVFVDCPVKARHSETGYSICDFRNLPFRNPKLFKADNLHNHLDAWKDIDPSEEVFSGFDSFSEITQLFSLSV
jgi:hypothetical protein